MPLEGREQFCHPEEESTGFADHFREKPAAAPGSSEGGGRAGTLGVLSGKSLQEGQEEQGPHAHFGFQGGRNLPHLKGTARQEGADEALPPGLAPPGGP